MTQVFFEILVLVVVPDEVGNVGDHGRKSDHQRRERHLCHRDADENDLMR